MRVLHLGNIANNSYNNVKYLSRRLSDKYAFDVISYDNPHGMSCPEWEESLAQDVDEYYNNWHNQGDSPGLRPNWFIEKDLYKTACSGKYVRYLPVRFYLEYFKQKLSYKLKQQGLSKYPGETIIPKTIKGVGIVLLVSPVFLSLSFLSSVARKLDRFRCANTMSAIGNDCIAQKGGEQLLDKYMRVSHWLEGYDLVEAYATDVIYAYLNRNNTPYIAYEHGTLRDLPFEKSIRGKLLRKAYKNASHIFITNPDVIGSAEKLGLKRFSFIPHVVDTDRYKPGHSDVRQTLGIGDGMMILAPARQNWHIKGNQILVEGFKAYLDRGGKGTLVLCDWGQHTEETRRLVRRLRIDKNVTFFRPAPKRYLLKLYQAADVVADQFVIGTFGGIVPEAMSCCKPVITRYEPAIHEWCFSEHPPVLNANSVGDIADHLQRLNREQGFSEGVGVAAREWVKKHYSVNIMVERHREIYNKILSGL